MDKPPKDLQKLWYKKLKDSGFEDIEDENNELKVWSSAFRRKKSLVSWEAKESYYHMANKFLNEYQFENSLDKIVWEYHSNAISMRDISDLLIKTKVKKNFNRTYVWRILARLQDSMKKMYLNGYKSE